MFFNITRYERGSLIPYVFGKNDPKLPSHYEEEEAPLEYLSKVEEQPHYFFYQANEIGANCIRNSFQQKDHI